MNIIAKYSLIVFVAAIGITGQLLLRKAMGSFNNMQLDNFILNIFRILYQPIVILAISCYGVGMIAYLFLLSKLEITSIYPITTSITFGGITLFGFLLLDESLPPAKIAGIVFIVIGIVLIESFA